MLVPSRRAGPFGGDPRKTACRRADRERDQGPLSTPTGRLLAVDYGRRRIGVAVSDPTRTIASPHSAIENGGEPRQPPEQLLELVREAAPVAIVVGIPIQMDGSEGEMAVEAREFGRRLGEASGVQIVGWDERLTSARARRSLAETGRRGKRVRKGEEDMMAATHLLRGYMDANPNAGGEG
jgi:putative Holliday junction resolvase